MKMYTVWSEFVEKRDREMAERRWPEDSYWCFMLRGVESLGDGGMGRKLGGEQATVDSHAVHPDPSRAPCPQLFLARSVALALLAESMWCCTWPIFGTKSWVVLGCRVRWPTHVRQGSSNVRQCSCAWRPRESCVPRFRQDPADRDDSHGMVGFSASSGLHGAWSERFVGPDGQHLQAPAGSVYVERENVTDDKGKGHGSVGHSEKGSKGPRQPDHPPSRHALLARDADYVARCRAEHARVHDALEEKRRVQVASDRAAEQARAKEEVRKEFLRDNGQGP